MKIIESACVFALMATLAACDSGAPAPNSATSGPVNSTAKLAESAPAAAPGSADSSSDVDADVKRQDPIGARYTPGYDKCLSSGEAAQGVTPAMVDCITAETAIQDQRLNREYKTTLEGMEPAARPKLVQAQRSWIAYRDDKCISENQTGGSIDRISGAGCILDETVRRTIELETMRETN